MCLEIHTDIANCLHQGKNVIVHSRKSWGRAPTVLATYLLRVHPELKPDVAIEHVRNICGRHAVQTVKQYNHIHEYYEHLVQNISSQKSKDGRASPIGSY
jgi:protein-tyrosine phosphatase|tara:strand:+ start:858 stop:1157 length:300 start_codon:yes stop_codon:yes gene_type:complete